MPRFLFLTTLLVLIISCSPVTIKKELPKRNSFTKLKEPKREIFYRESRVPTQLKHYYDSKLKEIRVALLQNVKKLKFKVVGNYKLNSNLILKRGNYSAVRYGKLIRLYKGTQKITTVSKLSLKPINNNSYISLNSKRVGKGYHWSSKKALTFKGEFTIINKKSLSLISKVDIEDYLKGVVPSEMPADAPLEALKAQAILARTNGYRSIIENSSRDYDILSSVYDQAYHGESKRDPKSDRAVEETENLILTYEKKPINAFFHAVSPGLTDYSRNIWETIDLPYIEPVWTTKTIPKFDLSNEDQFRVFIDTNFPSYYDLSRYNIDRSLNYLLKYYRWEQKVKSSTIRSNIKKRYKKDLGTITRVSVISRTTSGKISKIYIKGSRSSITLNNELQIRKSLSSPSLYSGNFYVVKSGSNFIFKGSGHGHGGGMCQASAIGLSFEGSTYNQILNKFYPKAIITTVR